MALPSLKGIGITAPSISFASPTSGLNLGGAGGEIGKTQTSTQAIPTLETPNIEPVQIATDILHGIARSGGAIGLELTQTPELQPPEGTLERKVKDIIFGPETLQSLSTRIAEGEQTARQLGIPIKGPFEANPALLASGLFVGGTIALDFSGIGGEKKLAERLLEETSPDIISKLLTKIGVGEELLPKYSKLFAKAKTPEEVSTRLQALAQEAKSVPEVAQAKELGYKISESEKGFTNKRFKYQIRKGNDLMYANTPEEVANLTGQTTKVTSIVQKTQTISTISPELQPLAQEARKYKSAEEFIQAVRDARNPTREGIAGVIKRTPEQQALFDITKKAEKVPNTFSNLTDFYNQVARGISEPTLETGTKSLGEEVKGSIDRLTEAIQTAKPARKELEKAFTAERAKRTGAVAGIFERGGGQKGYFQALGKLKGELAPAEKKAFEIGNNLVENDINSLFKAAQLNPSLDVYEKLNTQSALTKILSGVIPTNSELSLLEKTYGSKLVGAVLTQRTTGQKILAGLEQLTNLPRTIMASFDLSAPFRQGLMLISHPKKFGSAFVDMFKQFGSETTFKAAQESIARMPEYALMKQGKLALTDVGVLMTNREEKFMASWAEKIPILKYPIMASNRAYVGFLNKLRADVFTDIVKGARAGGREIDEKLIKEIANFVNAASGRGSIGGLERGAVALNGIFFSPRLMASRIHFLNPVNYITADLIVRKEMLKSVFTVLGSGLTVLGLAKMAGAKVGDNPNSADFGKILIGKTRIDIWGGFQQYVRAASQLVSGKYVSSTTGKQITLGEGYKPITKLDILGRVVESKEAPVLSFLVNLLKQQDYAGQPIKITHEVASRFVPMAIGDMYDIAKDNPELLPASLLGVFGVGLQTYEPKKFPVRGKEFSGVRSSPLKQNKGALKGLKGVGL